jgi:tetratricopeptide (TPR) repeat protein/DNA-binding MarR family transcriptional regulator
VTVRARTVKEKILLHLFDYSRFTERYESPPEVTQEAIARAVEIRVHHVNQYVKPLVSEDLVEERTAHVSGVARRRKVYFLTSSGRSRVAALREELLDESVPLRRADGQQVMLPLAQIYQEERRGSTLLTLLQEFAARGVIAESIEVRAPGTVEFTQEAVKPDRFFGRSQEIDTVLHAIEETPMIVVTGMAGIGKSAFAAMVCEGLRGNRSLFWREVRPWDTATDLAFRLAAFLKSHGRLALASILVAGESQELGRLEERLQADLEGLPALLVFDDVHQAADDAFSFFGLLLKILKRRGGTSALILSRTVPEFYSRREVAVEGAVRELALAGLDRASSAALLGDMGVRDPFAGSLVEACGGSPLFLKLVSRTRPEDAPESGWRTLEVYIAEQIDPALDTEERACMEAASFYSVPVSSDGVLVEGKSGRKVLGSLERKGLLYAVQPDRYTIHDVIQSYFQTGLSAERRAALAPRISSWLQDEGVRVATGGRLQEAISYLGNAVAVEVDRARRSARLQRLGDMRFQIGDHIGAMEAFRGALRDVEEATVRARLLEKIAMCLIRVGQLDAADQEIVRGLDCVPVQPSVEASWLLYRRASVSYERQDFARTLEDVDRVTGWLAGTPHDPELWGGLANYRGLVHLYDPGRFDAALAQQNFRQAIEAWRTADYKRGLCMAYNNTFLAAVSLGKGEEALPYLDECVAIADSLGDVPSRLTALFTKAWYLSEHRGDYEGAESLYRETYRLAKGTHAPFRVLWHYRHFADLYRHQGRYAEARESLKYFLDASGSMLSPQTRIADLALMVRVCVLGGLAEAAQASLDETVRLASVSPSDFASCMIEWARASLLGRLGDAKGARASFQRAREAPWPRTYGERSELLLECGRFLADLGDAEEAKAVLIEARKELSPGCLPLEQEIDGALGRLTGTYDHAGTA